MSIFWNRRRKSGQSAPKNSAPEPTGPNPQAYYSRGNRFFEMKAWDRALTEWRRAAQLWRGPEGAPERTRRLYAQARAVIALIFTVIIVYQLVFLIFPRDPFDIMLMATGQPNNRSWWDRFLDTGRPQLGQSHKMTMREWWSNLKRRLQRGQGVKIAGRRGVRPNVAERWENLLRQYGRWGLPETWDLDFAVISGNGLGQLGDYSGAVSVLEKGVRRTFQPEKLANLFQGLANIHYYKGYHLQPDGLAIYDLGQVGKAVRAYENSLRNEPRSLSYGNLGWMMFLLGNYPEAEKNSLKALEMNGNLHYVRLNLGLIYLMQGRDWRSFQAYRSVIRRNPAPEVFMGGINDLKEILRDNPGRHSFAYLILGILSVKHGEFGQAREALQRFLTSPFQGRRWKALARRLLFDLDTAEMER